MRGGESRLGGFSATAGSALQSEVLAGGVNDVARNRMTSNCPTRSTVRSGISISRLRTFDFSCLAHYRSPLSFPIRLPTSRNESGST
jgi:hypothetical protein